MDIDIDIDILSCERQYSSCGQVSYIIRENPIA